MNERLVRRCVFAQLLTLIEREERDIASSGLGDYAAGDSLLCVRDQSGQFERFRGGNVGLGGHITRLHSPLLSLRRGDKSPPFNGGNVGPVRFELTTFRLSAGCSSQTKLRAPPSGKLLEYSAFRADDYRRVDWGHPLHDRQVRPKDDASPREASGPTRATHPPNTPYFAPLHGRLTNSVTEKSPTTMSAKENLFVPVHKGLRAMIYRMGLRLGTADFTNETESNALAETLKRDLTRSVSDCLLCLFLTHAVHEETDLFPAVRRHAPIVADLMVREHREIVLRVHDVSQICDELRTLHEPLRRVELGERLSRKASELFAYYLQHMSNEEATMVPVVWEHYTDAERQALHERFYNGIPLAQFEIWMRWTLPALNPQELTTLLRSLRADPPPNRFADVMRVGREVLGEDRWAVIAAELES